MDSVTVTLIQLEKLSPARKEELNMSLNYLYKMHRTQIEELIERSCNVAFIPLGPTEVHGPHLPLWCDIVSGLDLAERAAKNCRIRALSLLLRLRSLIVKRASQMSLRGIRLCVRRPLP